LKDAIVLAKLHKIFQLTTLLTLKIAHVSLGAKKEKSIPWLKLCHATKSKGAPPTLGRRASLFHNILIASMLTLMPPLI
jgi:hypothetical protein